MRKYLVISAVNFSEGGPLTVLRDCLASAARILPAEWEIIALVHDQNLIDQSRVRLIEVPDAKRSWLRRLYYEWFGFRQILGEIKPDLWFSLHDITPRVISRRQAVYCHNPSPFYRSTLREASIEPRFYLFNKFYRYLYRILIRRNSWVIVQQAWMREEFKRVFGALPIVVAHPYIECQKKIKIAVSGTKKSIFFYPSLPRVFKNFEVICKAVEVLNGREGVADFEVRITLSGDENRYSKLLYEKYGLIPNLFFSGLQSREQMEKQYSDATAVVFPSKLETWGLPISEAKSHSKPLLLADLPYAREAVGNYDNVSFFPPTDADALADLMHAVIDQRWQPMGASGADPSEPFTRTWDELLLLLTKGL